MTDRRNNRKFLVGLGEGEGVGNEISFALDVSYIRGVFRHAAKLISLSVGQFSHELMEPEIDDPYRA